MKFKTSILAAALLSLGLMANANIHAQENTATQTAPAAADFSEQQLQQFINASEEIATLSQEYTQQLQSAEGESAQQEIQQEANEKMIETVEDSGLEVDTFNAIGQAVQTNPELMQRVQEMAGS